MRMGLLQASPIAPLAVVLIASVLSACSRPDKKLAERIKADLNAIVASDCSFGKCDPPCDAHAAAGSLTVECRAHPTDAIEARKYLTNKCVAMKEAGLQDVELKLTSQRTGNLQMWTADEVQAGDCSFKQDY